MHISSLHSHKHFPKQHWRWKEKPAPREYHRQADRIRDIRWFTAQFIQNLIAKGNLQGVDSLWSYKFVRWKTYRDSSWNMDMYIDIHEKDGWSTSAKIQWVSSWIYNRFQQMMYLHQKQRHYTRNRQKRTIKKRNLEQYKITAFHIFCAKVQNESQMNLRWLLLGYLWGNILKKIQGLHFPGADSTHKDHAKYAQILQLINDVKVLLEGWVQTLWEFLRLKKSLWKIISISQRNDDSSVWEKAKELLGWVLEWFTKSQDEIHNIAQYIEKNEWNSQHTWGGKDLIEKEEPYYAWLTMAESDEYEDMHMAWIAKEEEREMNLETWQYELESEYFDPDQREEYQDVENASIQEYRGRERLRNVYLDEVSELIDAIYEISWVYDDQVRELQSIYWRSIDWADQLETEFKNVLDKINEQTWHNIHFSEYSTEEIKREIQKWFLWLIHEIYSPMWSWLQSNQYDTLELRNKLIRKYLEHFPEEV